jgi:MFS family permease
VVNGAILASSAALAASLGLVLVPPGLVAGRLARRRSRRGKKKRHEATVPQASAPAHVDADADGAGAGEGDLHPQLSNPFRSGGRRPAWYGAVGIALLGGVVAAAAVAPLAGLAVGAVLLLGLLVDRSRVVLVLGALGFITLTGVVMARGQFVHRFVPDINWPAHFPMANSFTWLAICLLAADAVVVAVRLRPSSARSEKDGGPREPEGGPTQPGAAGETGGETGGEATEGAGSAEHGHGGGV